MLKIMLLASFLLVSTGFVFAQTEDPKLFPIIEKGKIGYIDGSGKKIIKPQFDMGISVFRGSFSPAQFFHEGLAVAAQCSEKPVRCNEGFINGAGRFVIPAVYDSAWHFSEGLAAVKSGEKWGYINHSGVMVIAPQFVSAYAFRNGFAEVQLPGGEKRLVDPTGKFLPMPRGVQDFGRVSEGLVAVKVAGKWGFIDTRGRMVIQPQFEGQINDMKEDNYSGEFSGGLAAVRSRGKWGYVNRAGKLVIPARYDKAEEFNENIAAVSQNYKWSLINNKGGLITPRKFGYVYTFTEGLLPASAEDGKWGFVDRSGTFMIPATYDAVTHFQDGLAAVRAGDQWGYIDRNGNLTIKPQFKTMGYFRDGLALQIIREHLPNSRVPVQWGYINKAAKFVWKSDD